MRVILILFILMTAQGQDRNRGVIPAGPDTGAKQHRVALVIGNNDYSWGKLSQAVPDARAIRDLLPRIGFVATNIFYGENLALKDFQKLRRRFLDPLKPNDLAFIYYSGHGIEANGVNYLVPIGFPAD